MKISFEPSLVYCESGLFLVRLLIIVISNSQGGHMHDKMPRTTLEKKLGKCDQCFSGEEKVVAFLQAFYTGGQWLCRECFISEMYSMGWSWNSEMEVWEMYF